MLLRDEKSGPEPNDLEAIGRHLDQLNTRLGAWWNRLDEVLREQGIGPDDLVPDNKSIERAMAKIGKDPWEEVYTVLDSLCAIYVDINAAQRQEICHLLNSKHYVLNGINGYVSRNADLYRETKDSKWVGFALTSVIIEDGRTDYRDILMSLAYLYLTIVDVGELDPYPQFQAAAEQANGSIRDMLAHFDEARAKELDRSWRED
jgi:hypothetical protein